MFEYMTAQEAAKYWNLNQTEISDHLTMRGYFPYRSNVSPAKYILNFGRVGHILSKTK